jgi:hypothetical protein
MGAVWIIVWMARSRSTRRLMYLLSISYMGAGEVGIYTCGDPGGDTSNYLYDPVYDPCYDYDEMIPVRWAIWG